MLYLGVLNLENDFDATENLRNDGLFRILIGLNMTPGLKGAQGSFTFSFSQSHSIFHNFYEIKPLFPFISSATKTKHMNIYEYSFKLFEMFVKSKTDLCSFQPFSFCFALSLPLKLK